MEQFKTLTAIGWLCVVLTALSAFGCSPAGQKGNEYPVVSPVPIETGRLFEAVKESTRVELYYGEGDCAPRFANGMRGTCINNKPCNGFGIKNEKGEMDCECFGVKGGGCGDELICSTIERACIPQSKAERLLR